MSLISCPECEKELSDTVKKCPNCGYKLSKSKKKLIIIFIMVIIILISVSIISFNIYNNDKKNKYIENANNISRLILENSGECEEISNLTVKVWYNAIYEKSDITTDKYIKKTSYIYNDFDTAISNLFVDKKSEIVDIKSKNEEINNLFKVVNDSPKEMENLKSSILEFYSAYQELYQITVNPTGTYSEYATKKNEVVNNCLLTYNKTQLLLK